MSIFLAAVLAFPTAWPRRLVGAVGGLAVLYGINVLRLATLGYIGAIDDSPGQRWFNFIHEYVWQGIFIVFVVAVWMIWIEFVVKARRE
jgi:exosortase/archaeosortase family protein